MDIITTHINTDFDGLAAMVAAQKLYPSADLVFPGKTSRHVAEFLALHKDMLKIRPLKLLDMSKVRRLIIVDTHSPQRIGKLAQLMEQQQVEVHIYDHHPANECYLSYASKGQPVQIIEPLGAATTILVEIIRERKLTLTPLEATILALGIYSDTGCMVFSSTTARDVAAVAYLLNQGANLTVIAEFLDRPLIKEQQDLLKKLLLSAQRHNINGVTVLLAETTTGEFIDGLALLIHKLAEVEQTGAVFLVVKMEERVHLVARSAVAEVNCAGIVGHFGGGGHAAAASASIKNTGLAAVTAKLLLIMQRDIKPVMTVREIMSTPVKVVHPQTKIEEANQVMLRYGHTGLPVVRGLNVIGMISRRDVEKAVHHNLGHAPVKAYMQAHVQTIQPDVTVTKVQNMMIEFDIGRLPVVENDEVLGIVSRSDILRTLHPNFQERHYTMFNQQEQQQVCFETKIKQALPQQLLELLHLVGELARKHKHKVYAAGGIVRDVILGKKNLDVDLIVEGSAIHLAKVLGQALGGNKVRTHQKFGTAAVLLADGSWLDLATARVEYYEYPAALPTVETSSLRADLYRRDFTVNAMAVSLNLDSTFELLDYFGGQEDLQAGIIRVLHNLSFVEDPTRILRAVRFEQRYQMHMDPQTLHLLQDAVQAELLSRVSDDRLWHELIIILNEPEPADDLRRLADLGVWDQIFPGIIYWEVQPVLDNISQALMTLHSWDWVEPAERWLAYFIAMLYWTKIKDATEICARFAFSNRQTEKVQAAISHWRKVLAELSAPADLKISQIAQTLKRLPLEAYPMFLAIMDDPKVIHRFRLAIEAVAKNKPLVNGKDIKQLGFKPGPLFRQALKAVWQARLDGVITSKEAELAFVKKYMEKNS